jgi:hypothetical protein
MKKLLFLLLALASCKAGYRVTEYYQSREEPTQAHIKWLENMRTYNATFAIPADKAAEAWGRAQVFVSKYSSMKIQTVSDFVIETYNTPQMTMGDAMSGNVKFAYTITKSPKQNDVEFTVECRSNGGDGDGGFEYRRDNEHFASYYIQTGENIQYPKFIGK